MGRNTELKKENIQLIRHCFYTKSTWTKNELSKQTGISPAAATHILLDLISSDEVIVSGKAPSTGGRKSKQYLLNPDYCHIGTIIFNNHADDYRLIAQSFRLNGDVMISFDHPYTHRIDDFFVIVDQLLATDPLIRILAISVPGVVDHGFISLCDFKEFEHIDLGKLVYEKFQIDCLIENDVNIAAYAYSKQHAIHDMVLLYQPKNEFIGCGIIIDGHVYHGVHKRAGEVRFLPPYSESEWRKRTLQHPELVLKDSIFTLKAVLDPEAIVYLSDYEIGHLDIAGSQAIKETRIDHYISSGLFEMGKQKILNRENI